MSIENFNGTNEPGKHVGSGLERTTAAEGSRRDANADPAECVRYESFGAEYAALTAKLRAIDMALVPYSRDSFEQAEFKTRRSHGDGKQGREQWMYVKGKMVARRNELVRAKRQLMDRLAQLRPRLKAERLRRAAEQKKADEERRAARERNRLADEERRAEARSEKQRPGLRGEAYNLAVIGLLGEIRDLLRAQRATDPE